MIPSEINLLAKVKLLASRKNNLAYEASHLLPPAPTKLPLGQQVNQHLHKHNSLYRWTGIVTAILLFFTLGVIIGHSYYQGNGNFGLSKQNVYAQFLLEIYDTVKDNYWDKIDDKKLIKLYTLGVEKLTGQPQNTTPADRDELKQMLTGVIENISDQDKQKNLTVTLGNLVLANLSPFERSRLFTSKTEKELRDNVSNIDKTVDLYKTLGVDKNTPPDKIKQTYEQKVNELAKDKSPEAQKKLADAGRAFATLGRTDSKKFYDQSGAETTVLSRVIEPDIFYLQLKKISPQTFDEFQTVTAMVTDKPLTSLILDLRGNIGGAIDILPYFLGFFIGQDQYGYELFHQGEPEPFKTKTGWLPSLAKYKKVVVLIDGQTQSSAEVIAATIKKYNVGVVIGSTTKGWGTVENTFPLKTTIDPTENYSAFLVHSLTLRDDNQPIEGRGVNPTIKLSDKNWPEQLMTYYNYGPLAEAVKQIIAGK
ncbi:MAG: hypothetical protein HY973_04090 [Candidatus Kerfeldbacteria bacterium]|nr:hypothetical protein [Candidatus Kerfeldbacteria bacterium]